MLFIFMILSLQFISCNEKNSGRNSTDKANKKRLVEDTTYIDGDSFQEGLESFNDKHFSMALLFFEDVRSSDKFYIDAQEYMKITKDSIEVQKRKHKLVEAKTLVLIDIIDNFRKKHGIDGSLLLDSLVAKDIISEDELNQYFENKKDNYTEELTNGE
ncbi:MAG: hypothetical protein ACOYN6_11235 [Ignavibacteria bacterium]